MTNSHLITDKYADKNLQAAIKIVCLHFKIKPSFMSDRSRQPRNVEARQAVWYLLKKMHNYSYTRIAELAGKDHTTIISGVKHAIEIGIPAELGFNTPEIGG